MRKNQLYLSNFVLFLVFSTLACGFIGGEAAPTDIPESKPIETTSVGENTAPIEAVPTDTPEPIAKPVIPLGDEYRSLDGGFAFRPIPNYSLDEVFGFATMIAPDGDPNLGPALIMIGEVSDEVITLDELYSAQIAEYSGEDIEVSEPREVVVGGAPGLVVEVSGTEDGEDIIGRIIVVLVSPNQQFTLISASPAKRWDSFETEFEAVQSTISFFEPEFGTSQLNPLDVPDDLLGNEYTSGDGSYTFRVLKDFILNDSNGNLSMIAIDGDDQTGPGIFMEGGIGDRELSLDEAYEYYMSNFPSTMSISPPRDEIIGGALGRTVDLHTEATSENAGAGRITIVLVNPTTTFIIGGIAPTDQWEDFAPSLEAVKATVNFNVPVSSSDDSHHLPDGYYQSEEGYALIQPEDYSLEESDGHLMMFAPGADPQYGPGFFAYLIEDNRENALGELLDENLPTEVDVTFGPENITLDGRPGFIVELGGVERGVEMMGKQIVLFVETGQYLILLAASPADQWGEFSPLVDEVITSLVFLGARGEAGSTVTDGLPGEEIHQWAKFAFASSEYGNPDWAASQAVGEPDVLVGECADHQNAWASEGSDTVEWLELQYETPVIPTQINIIQTHSPDQVVKVELVDMTGAFREIYADTPENLWDECPFTLSILVEVDYGIVGLKITIDQSVISTTWNEIDAVELIGFEFEE